MCSNVYQRSGVPQRSVIKLCRAAPQFITLKHFTSSILYDFLARAHTVSGLRNTFKQDVWQVRGYIL